MKRRVRGERGAALVETALTLPLLLLITIGLVEIGRAYQTWQVLTNAAREGARMAVLPGVGDEAVRERVRTYLEAGRLPAAEMATITITRDHEIAIGTGSATASRVEIGYPFTFIALGPVAELVAAGSTAGGPLTVRASATMRNE
jgi:Flp pilus assembly protein TadG